MAVEFLLGACSGVPAYQVVRRALEAKARRMATERLTAADRLLKRAGFSYVWYHAEAGSNDSEMSDALLLVGTQSDRIVATSSGHLAGTFHSTDSLHVAGTVREAPAPDRPALRLVISNDDPT